MKMVQQTSIDSYIELLPSLGKRQIEVLRAIRDSDGLNNREISIVLNLPINSITPRVKELRIKGLVKESGKITDKVTNRKTITWRVCDEVRKE